MRSNAPLPGTIRRSREEPIHEEEEELIRGVAVIPYCQTVTNRSVRLLRWQGIKATSYPLSRMKQHLWSVKDSLGLKVPSVYWVPCECGATYVGRRVCLCITEHKRHVQLDQAKLGFWTWCGVWEYFCLVSVWQLAIMCHQRIVGDCLDTVAWH